jgi:hypothetical protein
MNTSQVFASAALAAGAALLNGGGFTFYSGAMPASPETALSGNTALCAFTFSSTAFGTPSYSGGYMSAAASFTASSETPSANGTANFARLTESGGTALLDVTVQAPWQASTAVIVGQYVTNGGNSYVCATAGATAASGGPSGTGTGIDDGTAVWNYSAAGADYTIGNALLQTGVPLTMSSFTLKLPAV